MSKILVATEKPFHPNAITQMREIVQNAGHQMQLLEKYGDKSELTGALADSEALIVRSDKITSEVIAEGKKLKIIVRGGAGYDNIDLDAASARNIVVMNTPGQNANAVAELALGMMVYSARNLFNGKPGTELRGKTLGIQAYGNVGRRVAQIAQGFGMKISAHDPFLSKETIERDGLEWVEDVESLYRKNQYVSVHIPANDKTIKSINYALLSTMPEGAVLVNTARKEIIDEEGLLQMFAQRDDFNYVSDIAPDCQQEIASNYPGRYYFTPKKMGAQTAEANINAGIAAANQIIKFFEKGDTTFQVNK